MTSIDKPGPEKIGTSKGGSSLLKYDTSTASKPQLGFLDESAQQRIEVREGIYEGLFGEPKFVYHEVLPLKPHIDVYCCPPNAKRDFYTFVTGGVSDIPMNSPPQFGGKFRRIELIFYAADDKQEYAELLRRLGHVVHDNNMWLFWGHTMPNGDPPSPLFEDGPLDSLFFMPPVPKSDLELGKKLTIESDPVNLLWCVPITSAECRLKLDQGADAIFELFAARQHPFVFRGQRNSYV